MRFIQIFIFALLSLGGFCQPMEFNLTYSINTNPSFYNLIEQPNSYLIMGKVYAPIGKFLFCKINKNNLQITNNLIYGDSVTGYYLPFDFINYSANQFVSTGSFEKNYSGNYKSWPIIVDIDTNLNVINDTLIPILDMSFDYVKKINNKLTYGGTTIYNNSWDTLDDGSGFYGSNFLFWKTSLDFTYVNHNSIGVYDKTDVLRSMSIGFDNNVLLGGATFAHAPPYITGMDRIDWYLVNTDTNGQVLGEHYYGNPALADLDGISTILASVDSCYYLSGYYGKYVGVISVPHIVKLNRQFQTLWEKHIEQKNCQAINKLIKTCDGHQVLLTQHVPVTINYNIIYSKLTKFDTNGNILWYRDFFKGDTTQYIRYRAWDVIETSDKGFALCGSAIDTANVGPDQEAWLVKTDSLGCDGLRSCNDTALVCEILNAPDTACKNDTAWLQVRFKGRSAPYFVYANTTLALDSVYYPYTLPLWIDTLVPYYPTTTGIQQVIIKVQDPWGWYNSDTVEIYVKNCGSGNIEEAWYPKKVEIYPNPATTELHVKFRNTITDPVTITIYDMQGKVVKQIITKQNETIIDISGLEQGVYGIRVTGNDINASERFIKL